jgi:cobalt-zinc-cadmium efflux system membrane fusion protein
MITSFPHRSRCWLAAGVLLATAPFAFSHAGHDKAPGDDASGPVTGPIAISAEARKNLGLVTADADLRRVEKTLLVLGELQSIPSHNAAVSSRVAGRVAAILATDGEMVKKGDPIVEIETLQLGDPPPHVTYNAPIDGVVSDRHVVLGDSVEPSKHLVEVVDLSEIYAEGRLFEGQVSAVKIGQTVRIVVESFPDETFTGKMERFDSQLDEETRTLKVWVRIANKDLKLRPNMRARLSIVVDKAEDAIAVPLRAILGEAGNLFAYVQSDTDELVFERRPVVTGLRDDQYIEVSEGIFPGDKVVTVGNYQLQYVTTRKKPAVPPPSEGAAPMKPAEADHEHPVIESHPQGIFPPVLWMGVTLGVLLALNLIVMLFKRRTVVNS